MALTIGLQGRAPLRSTAPIVTIGRVEGNDVVVPDPRISSRHGRLVRRGEVYAYEDLGSRNGSLLERGGDRAVLRAYESHLVRAGDRLLLGDLVSPVVLTIESAPDAGATADSGATVLAARAVVAEEPRDTDLRELFRLLRDLSGQTDPSEVMERILDAVVARFPHAVSCTVLLRDHDGELVPEARRGEGRAPSRTLMGRAMESREVVSYVPEGELAPQSVAGLAGSVVVPLLAGDEAIGVLHVASATRAFDNEDLGWLGVVGTHVAAGLVGARRFRALRAERDGLRYMGRPILGESEALKKALHALERVARTPTTVLVTGETGTGKELAARYVHAHSPRAEHPFAAVNCAALAETLLSSELFGHRKGAFTGADRDRKGLFESAHGGTVFLDEIGEITPAVQVKLLRVLQEREVQPVGSTQPVKVDVRIVAATNRELLEEVKAGRFREDLYYRLAVFPVQLPPLRDRIGDVTLLATRFREVVCARHDRWVGQFTTRALEALRKYAWPGNVRQLEHEIERAVILSADGDPIDVDCLSPQVTGVVAPDAADVQGLPRGELKAVMNALELRVVERALEEHGGNRTRAAETLGISRQALQAKLAKWRDA